MWLPPIPISSVESVVSKAHPCRIILSGWSKHVSGAGFCLTHCSIVKMRLGFDALLGDRGKLNARKLFSSYMYNRDHFVSLCAAIDISSQQAMTFLLIFQTFTVNISISN